MRLCYGCHRCHRFHKTACTLTRCISPLVSVGDIPPGQIVPPQGGESMSSVQAAWLRLRGSVLTAACVMLKQSAKAEMLGKVACNKECRVTGAMCYFTGVLTAAAACMPLQSEEMRDPRRPRSQQTNSSSVWSCCVICHWRCCWFKDSRGFTHESFFFPFSALKSERLCGKSSTLWCKMSLSSSSFIIFYMPLNLKRISEDSEFLFFFSAAPATLSSELLL